MNMIKKEEAYCRGIRLFMSPTIRSQEHLEWIKRHKMYNFRMGGDKGAVAISENSTKARFLLLYNSDNVLTPELFEISPGFKVKFKDELPGYPSPKRDFYMIVENVCRG